MGWNFTTVQSSKGWCIYLGLLTIYKPGIFVREDKSGIRAFSINRSRYRHRILCFMRRGLWRIWFRLYCRDGDSLFFLFRCCYFFDLDFIYFCLIKILIRFNKNEIFIMVIKFYFLFKIYQILIINLFNLLAR